MAVTQRSMEEKELIRSGSQESLEDGEGSGSDQGTVDQAGWRRRWTMVMLCFVAFALCNLDRVNMSIAILPISSTFNLSKTQQGLVQSSFFWGYSLTQILGGVWADKYGAKRVLGFGVVWWSCATMLTPVGARVSLPALLVLRAAMGVGEGVALPAMNSMVSRWVPVKERSRSLAMVYSGLYLGSVVGLGGSAHLIARFGWPSVFYGFGALGLLWFGWWVAEAASTPGEDPHISQRELKFIQRHAAAQRSVAKASSIPWHVLLSKPPVWALMACHFCHSWAGFLLQTYMPTYYAEELGLDLKTSGFFSVLPFVSMLVCSLLSGWIADNLVERGVPVTTVRKSMQTIGFLGPALFLTQLRHVRSAGSAVSCMVAALGLKAFSKAGLFSNHQDIGPKYAGVLLGISNTAGCVAGVVGTAVTGLILQNGSWDQVWAVAVALLVGGTVVWNALATGERVFE